MADLADRLLQDEDSKDDLTTEARSAEIAATLDAAPVPSHDPPPCASCDEPATRADCDGYPRCDSCGPPGAAAHVPDDEEQEMTNESLKVQTRSETDGIEYFDTLKSALAYTRKNRNVWKISFNLPTGERVRLVRDIVADTRVWVYEALLQE